MQNRIVVMALILAIALTITITYAAGVTQAPFSPHNPDSDGTRWIHHETPGTHPVQVQHARLDRTDPPDATNESLLIIAPQTAYGEQEIETLARFLQNGGRALIADETGAGRHLVDRLDLGVTISRGPIFSTSYIDDPLRPLVENTNRLEGIPQTVEMTRTHAVQGNGDAVLRTHELSWIDLDHDAAPSLGEPQGAFAVARITPAGQGELMVVGAPAIFQQTPHTQDPAALEETRQALLAWLTENDRRLILHEAHRGAADPFAFTPLLAESTPLLQATLALGVAALIVLSVFGIQVRRVRPARRRPDPQQQNDPALRAALFELPEP